MNIKNRLKKLELENSTDVFARRAAENSPKQSLRICATGLIAPNLNGMARQTALKMPENRFLIFAMCAES